MATVRMVRRGGRSYYYLVQSYRWEGSVRKKELYLGTSIPQELTARRLLLERAIWKETWFRQFDVIGEAYRKRLRSVPSSVLEKEAAEFVIEFTFDSNRIEGSTLSLEDTRLVLERGITPGPKPLSDIQETWRHAQLLRRLVRQLEPIDLSHLLRWHRELFEETKPDIAGRVREYEVRIRGSRHVPPPPLEVRPLLLELLRWVSRPRPSVHPVQLAGEFHFRFEHIHPFGDGNGRIGRLALNLLLDRLGFPMINIPYIRRRGYYRALEQSNVQSDSRPFLHWFFLRYRRANQFYLPRGPGTNPPTR